MSQGSHYNAVSIAHSSDHFHETFHISVSDSIELFLAMGFSAIRDEALCRNTVYSVVQMIQEELFAGSHKRVFEAFEKALKQVNVYLNKRNLHEIGLFHAAIGLQMGDTLHVSKTGLGEVFLIRKKTVTNVTADFDATFEDIDPSSEPTIEDLMKQGEIEFFSNVATGEISPNDILLFSSYKLSRYVDTKLLHSFFAKGQLEVGFLNLEHKLKEEKDSDLAIIGRKIPEEIAPVQTTSFSFPRPGRKTATQVEPQERKRTVPDRPKITLPQSTNVMRSLFNQWIDKAAKLLSFNSTSMKDPEQRRRIYTLATAILLVILVLSVGSSLSNQQNAELLKEYEIVMNNAKQELQLATTANIKQDKAEARVHLDSARELLSTLQEKNVYQKDIEELLADLQQQEDTANNVVRITEEDLFINLESKLEADVPKGILESNDKLYVYSSSSIYGPFVSSADDASKRFTLDTTDLILDVIPFDDIDGLLIKLTPDKMAQFVNGAFSFTDTTGVSWKSGSNLGSFGSNVYLLGTDQVWKYTRNRSTYRGPEPWLKQTDPSLATAVSFAVDGAMYILQNDGSISKYFRGAKVSNFEVTQAPESLLSGLNDKSQILTTPDWTYVYVFNHEKGVVGAFYKDNASDKLVFEKQFVFDGEDIVAIEISDNESNLYAISSSGKVFRIIM